MESTTIQSRAQKIHEEIERLEKELQEEEEQLKIDRQRLKEEKDLTNPVKPTDVIELNVDGEIIATTRQTITNGQTSILSILFNGRWEQRLDIDNNDNIRLDFNPILFRHLLDQLQILHSNDSIQLIPPSQPSLVEPFKKTLRKLGFHKLLSSQRKDVITLNVGGQTITNRHRILAKVSNSTSAAMVLPSTKIELSVESDGFVDYDPKLFQYLMGQLRGELFDNISYLGLTLYDERIAFVSMIHNLSIPPQSISFPPILMNTKWKQNALTVAGGDGSRSGTQLNQLNHPQGMYVDEDAQCMYIADWGNHRIVQWKFGATVGEIVIVRNKEGHVDNLFYPRDVTLDRNRDSLIICDQGHRRIVQWPRQHNATGQTIIFDIDCFGLTIDNNGNLYVVNYLKDEVRQWKAGEINGTIIAGGNGRGDHLNQLNNPIRVFVDQDQSVYVVEWHNHRVMKWLKGAKEGIIVAGGHGPGNSLRQLSSPRGVVVDYLGNVYVADVSNHRIMCWPRGSIEGRVIIGENGSGRESNQLNLPRGLSFDRHGNLYVIDDHNHRIQKFQIDLQEITLK